MKFTWVNAKMPQKFFCTINQHVNGNHLPADLISKTFKILWDVKLCVNLKGVRKKESFRP